uniref:hypothetical protein n=1 Tax=Geovibrio ferrireducens TaxID=46201 RepID=UPI0022486022
MNKSVNVFVTSLDLLCKLRACIQNFQGWQILDHKNRDCFTLSGFAMTAVYVTARSKATWQSQFLLFAHNNFPLCKGGLRGIFTDMNKSVNVFVTSLDLLCKLRACIQNFQGWQILDHKNRDCFTLSGFAMTAVYVTARSKATWQSQFLLFAHNNFPLCKGG